MAATVEHMTAAVRSSASEAPSSQRQAANCARCFAVLPLVWARCMSCCSYLTFAIVLKSLHSECELIIAPNSSIDVRYPTE